MQQTALKIKYALTIIFLLGFFEPLMAAGTTRCREKKELREPMKPISETDAADSNNSGGLKRFAYAELMYQVHFSIPKFVLTGKTIGQELRKAVSGAAYRDDALEIMGDNGWELVSVITRNFDGGFELFFYFKKPVDS